MGCNCSKRIRSHSFRRIRPIRQRPVQNNAVESESKLSLMKQMWEDAKTSDSDDTKKE